MNTRLTVLPITLFILTAIVLSVTLLGIQATAVGASTSTVSSTVSITVSTPTQTATSTPVISLTPTVTATPAYPSVQDIKAALDDNFSEINGLLQEINQKIEPKSGVQTSLDNIRDNLISSFIWDYLGNPLVTSLLTLLGSLSIVGKIVLRLKRNRDASRGRTSNQSDTTVNSILNIVIVITFAYVAIFTLLLLYISTGQIISQVHNTTDLVTIVEKLDRIENELQARPTITPTPTIQTPSSSDSTSHQTSDPYANRVPIVISVLLLGLFASVMLILSNRKTGLGANEIHFTAQKLLEPLDKDLLTAILLALILLLLPYPADTLVLPFIIQYFIIAFFDVVYLYPNHQLKKVVIEHYSLLIFFAVLGVWWSFGEAAQRFLDPFWDANRNFPYNYALQSWVRWLDFAWQIAPLLLAVIIALPHWHHLRELTKRKALPKLLESLDAKNSGETT